MFSSLTQDASVALINKLASMTTKGMDAKIVLAESCTAGLASAILASVPGASAYHCGCFAVYRPKSKIGWLYVDRATIDKHTCESEEVARDLAKQALTATPEASYSAAIVGHLGPKATVNDGMIWCAFADRDLPELTFAYETKLLFEPRIHRQYEAAITLLIEFRKHLEKVTGDQ